MSQMTKLTNGIDAGYKTCPSNSPWRCRQTSYNECPFF